MIKLPPYGAALAERVRYRNYPTWVYIFAGANAWNRLRYNRLSEGDNHVLVWDGDLYRWPVSGCCVCVDIAEGPSVDQCRDLARCLLRSQARLVLLWWTDWRVSRPLCYYPSGKGIALSADDINNSLRPEVSHVA